MPVSSLFSRLLPDEFQRKRATIQQYQQFFYSIDTDAVFQMVEVMNVTADTLTVAVPSSALVNYLRLHSPEIRQQIFEQFHHSLELKIIARPDSMCLEDEKIKLKPAKHFSRSISDQVKKSASMVDDEDLQSALVSLSKAIREER